MLFINEKETKRQQQSTRQNLPRNQSVADMEAVAEERAVMIANELIHKKKKQQQQQRRERAQQQQASWNDQHLAHSVEELHLETSKEIFESENSAAWDAHDCNDPGMESAAEERAVMLANEMMEKLLEREKNQKETKK